MSYIINFIDEWSENESIEWKLAYRKNVNEIIRLYNEIQSDILTAQLEDRQLSSEKFSKLICLIFSKYKNLNTDSGNYINDVKTSLNELIKYFSMVCNVEEMSFDQTSAKRFSNIINDLLKNKDINL